MLRASQGDPIWTYGALFDPLWHGATLAGGAMASLWGLLCVGLSLARFRVPGPLWLGGLLLSLVPNQLFSWLGLRATTLGWSGREAPPAHETWGPAGAALMHDVVGLVMAASVLAGVMMATAVVQVATVGVEHRWTLSQGGMGAVVLGVGAALVTGFGLAGGGGWPAAFLAAWLLFAAAVVAVGCSRIEHIARLHAGRVLLAFSMVVGTLVVAVAANHFAEGTMLLDMAHAAPHEGPVLRLEASAGIATLRKCGLVSVMMAVVAAGASTGGSLHQASDPRGSVGGLFMLGGLGLFALMEALIRAQLGTLVA